MSLLKCLTLISIVAVLDAARTNCDYTFYKDAGGYLRFQEMPMTFDEAKMRCALDGGILASPINDGIKLAMIGIMNNTKVNFSGPMRVLTGISNKYNSYGIFSSVEGIRLSDIKHTWAEYEPTGGNKADNCITMLPDGTMGDNICDFRLPHFCFLKEVRANKLNSCGPKTKDYTLDTTIGSCYKFHRTHLVYDEAAKVCEGEGAHLLIINGDTEAEAVKNLFPTVDYDDTPLEDRYALIGFNYNNNTEEWMTLKGETIEEAGYAKWGPGEPNHSDDSSYYCGAVKYSGTLDDIWCDQQSFFICEKDPEILLCK